ncbi:hypothetical protein ACFMBG_13350, partial [Leisingera sp. D0M16]|uniref:hypothetical protein n=1 Tax=Leisingera coralii TaxID=3351347 RepID=UPI003B7D7CBB
MSEATVVPKVKGSAAGQYLGFALQPVRLFYHLLTCPSEASVGLEYVDDVSVHLGDDVVFAEQCKSYLTGNPISNWSTVFWKTLANWMDNVETGVFELEKTRFQMYVVPKKSPGFASHFSEITTDEEIDAALEDVRKKRKRLSDPPPVKWSAVMFRKTEDQNGNEAA